jgi:hypothetical protein
VGVMLGIAPAPHGLSQPCPRALVALHEAGWASWGVMPQRPQPQTIQLEQNFKTKPCPRASPARGWLGIVGGDATTPTTPNYTIRALFFLNLFFYLFLIKFVMVLNLKLFLFLFLFLFNLFFNFLF